MKVPDCSCLNSECIYKTSIVPYIDVPIMGRKSWESRITDKSVQLRHNYCPQCGKKYIEDDEAEC